MKTRKRAPSRARVVQCHRCDAKFETRHSQAKWCPGKCRQLGKRASWNRYGRRNKPARLEACRRGYRANKEAVIARTSAYKKTARGKIAVRRTSENQRRNFPEKYAARQAVLAALRSGRLTKKPCRECGAAKVEAHHPDYSKPLAVVWLCRTCHKKEHC